MTTVTAKGAYVWEAANTRWVKIGGGGVDLTAAMGSLGYDGRGIWRAMATNASSAMAIKHGGRWWCCSNKTDFGSWAPAEGFVWRTEGVPANNPQLLVSSPYDNRIYAICTSAVVNGAFDPVSRTWAASGLTIPPTQASLGTVGVSIGQWLIILGGVSTLRRWKSGDAAWTPCATLPGGFNASSITAFNGKLYAADNQGGLPCVSNDVGDTWTQLPAGALLGSGGNTTFLAATTKSLFVRCNNGSSRLNAAGTGWTTYPTMTGGILRVVNDENGQAWTPNVPGTTELRIVPNSLDGSW